MGLPWWSNGFNAGDTDSVPGQENKIPHAIEQLSLQATTGDKT